MRDTYETGGFFTPQDLKKMRDELDLGASPNETELDREMRAIDLLNRKNCTCCITMGTTLPPRDGRV